MCKSARKRWRSVACLATKVFSLYVPPGTRKSQCVRHRSVKPLVIIRCIDDIGCSRRPF